MEKEAKGTSEDGNYVHADEEKEARVTVEDGNYAHVDEGKEAKVTVEKENGGHADEGKEAKVTVDDGHVDVILNLYDQLCDQNPLVQKGTNDESDDHISRLKQIQHSFECCKSR
jgi:hypothetical protein